VILPEQSLRASAVGVFAQRGVPTGSAVLQGTILIEAQLGELPSHGLQRLSRLLLRPEKRLAYLVATGVHGSRRSGVLDLDDQGRLGPVVMMGPLDALAAGVAGVAVAAIRNANQIGVLAYYAEQAVDRGLVGVVLGTSDALVHPAGGSRELISTNPTAIGISTGAVALLPDLGSSQVSNGRIHSFALRSGQLEEGWAIGLTVVPPLMPRRRRRERSRNSVGRKDTGWARR